MAPFPVATHLGVSVSRRLSVVLCALAIASLSTPISHAFVNTGLVRFSYRYGGGFPSMQQQENSLSNNTAAAAAALGAAARTSSTPSATTTVTARGAAPPRAYIRGAAVAAGRTGQTPGLITTSSTDIANTKYSSALYSESPATATTGGTGDNSELLEKIKDVVSDQLKVDRGKVHLESNFIKDLNADSLDSVELVMAFEEKFGVTIPDEAATKIATVQDALSYITTAL